jgi:tRNA 5-methylaminomethyl-2-thiouridine biosynthesis bifunctional protein
MLDWRDGQPFSSLYADVYFSSASGIEEAHHVFLQGNRLAERFAAVESDGAFAIGETGFGTGLNFLCAWALWDRLAPRGARLHYVSTELHPLSRAELAQCLALWPVLQPHASALCAQWGGPLAPGWHRMRLAEGRVLLTLLVGDARATLPALRGAVNAWFLDGFSPARNPQMWEPSLLQAVARHSMPGTTLATYTSAGEVRRALGAAGFRVEKAVGFGPKREMLRGALPGRQSTVAVVREAVVIGGGLAGTSAAASLAQRGWKVTLLESDAALAAQASGNAQGILYARLSAESTPLSQFVLAGYQHTLRVLRQHLVCDAEQWSDCSVLQIAFDEREAKRQAGVLRECLPHDLLRGVDARQASECARLPLDRGGLLFPCGGWVHPPALCRAFASVPGVKAHTGRRAARLVRDGLAWRVLDGEHCIASAPVVVIAAAESSSRFVETAHLPLRTNRGQVTLLPATAASAPLSAVLCAGRYAAPARAGWHSVGATLTREASPATRAADNGENLARLSCQFPALFEALGGTRLDPAQLHGRAALRCTSPDYLPVVGPLEGPGQVPLPGLYVSTAHGSRGLITAPLAGEMLAAYLEDEPAPLSERLMCAADPRRFAPAAHSALPG